MATAFEGYVPSRRSTTTFGICDCISYTYFGLSVVLVTVGTAITILILGGIPDAPVFVNIGRMWLVGPILIFSGLMVAAKCTLYLRRRKFLIWELAMMEEQMFYRLGLSQRLRDSAAACGAGATNVTASPPSYEIIANGLASSQQPPPSYAEAMLLLRRPDRIHTGDDARLDHAPDSLDISK